MKFDYKYIIYALALSAAVSSCSKMNDLHDKYLDGEIVYAAKVDSVRTRAGMNRILLDVDISSQRVESVRVYWNNYKDSSDMSIGNRVGTFQKILDKMDENSYIFQLVSFDKFGNVSLPFESSGNVYGSRFQEKLSNRSIQSVFAGDAGLTVNWGGAPDDAVCTDLSYTDKDGNERTERIPVSENSLFLSEWSSGLSYRTLFLPEKTAIDTFRTESRTIDKIPYRYSTAEWTAESRNGNHNWDSFGGAAGFVLDNNINTGWHSRPGTPLPQCLVVDMQEIRTVDHLILRHLPQGLASNWIYFKTIEVYLSDDPITPDEYQSSWGTPVAVYEYPGGFDGITVNLDPNSAGRYLVLYFPNSRSNTYISFAELEIYR